MNRTIAIALALVAAWLPSLASAGGIGLYHPLDRPVTDDEIAATAAALDLTEDQVTALSLPPATGRWWVVGLTYEPCHGSAGTPLADAIVDARAKLDSLLSGEAVAGLSRALEALPCAPRLAERALLTEALELLGQAAQDESDEPTARAAYRQLLAMAPSYRLTSPPGTGYEVLWEEVRRDALSAGAASVAIQHGNPAVRVDGEPIPVAWTATASLAPGRHLLQWTNDDSTSGAWIEVADDLEEAALISYDGSTLSLLSRGPASVGARAAVEIWLQAIADGAGLDGVAVIQEEEPPSGYVVRGGEAEAWVAPLRRAGRTPKAATPTSADLLRIAVGGGWLTTGGAQYGDLTLALDLRLIGPLHLRVDGELGISEPIRFPGNPDYDGRSALLPGFGVGVAVHPTDGPAQPFAALSLGLWIVSPDAVQGLVDAATDAGANSDSLDVLGGRGPVTFRAFLDGGVDLLPGGGPLVIRVSGGVGYGFGFQARAGAQVGLRFGGKKGGGS
jgi:hypothetical protein